MNVPYKNCSFPATEWSLIRLSNNVSVIERNHRLELILNRYTPALRSYLMLALRVDLDDVDDLLQSFICDKMLDGNLLARANQRRGRFRALLMTAMNHHVVSCWRRDRALKRQPSELLNIDDMQSLRVSDDAGPSKQFDRQWARMILAITLQQMQEYCDAIGRMDIWEVFIHRIYEPTISNAPTMPYAELVSKFNLSSPTAAANLVVTARRMFRRFLTQEIGQYVNEAEIDDEISSLRESFSQS